MIKKEKQQCGNCIFWVDDGDESTPGLNPCKRYPHPQPKKKESNWCGEWKIDKKS